MKIIFSLIACILPLVLFSANTSDSLLKLASKETGLTRKIELMCDAGVWLRDKGKFDSAQIVLNQAMAITISRNDTTMQSLIYYYLGGVCWREGKYGKAENNYLESIRLRKMLHDTAGMAVAYVNLALVRRDITDYELSLQNLAEAMLLYKHLYDSSGIADAMSLSGGIFLRLNMYDSAMTQFYKAFEIRRHLNDSALIASSITNIATLYKTMGVFDSSALYFEKALSIQKNIYSQSSMAFTYLNLGGLYWESKNYIEAIDNYLKSLEIYETMKDRFRAITVLENIGLIYRDLGNIEKALEYHTIVLDFYKTANNELRESIALNFIAGDHLIAKDYYKALDIYRQSLEIRKRINNRPFIAASYNSMALVFKNIENPDSANYYYRQALQAYNLLGDVKNYGATLNNIANLKWKFKENDSAQYYFELAIETRQKVQDLQGEGYSLLQYAQLLIEQENVNKSILLSKKAFEISSQLNDFTLRRDAALLLSTCFEKHKNNNEAYKYFKIYNESQEALSKDETIKRIADMELRFGDQKLERSKIEIELKDAQIEQKTMRSHFLMGTVLLLACLVVSISISWRNKNKTNKILAAQNQEIETQRDQISQQSQKISDSIVYASRIQKAILTPEEEISLLFPENFIYYKPRDVVSGDFYWVHQENQYMVAVVADCSGHGVPGAFMSMLGVSLLNELNGEYSNFDAAKMLEYLRNKIRINLHQTSFEANNSDGMELGMVIIDKTNLKCCYCGGNIALWIWNNNQMEIYEPDRMPVGVYAKENLPFTNTFIDIKNNSTLYMFSDGIVDQFGGDSDRKLKSTGLMEIIKSIANKPLKEQGDELNTKMGIWQGNGRQVDDMIFMGIKLQS